MKALIANALLFQIVWFIAVQANDAVALVALGVYLAIHLLWFFNKGKQVVFTLCAALVGWLLDSVLANLGVIRFTGMTSIEVLDRDVWVAPVWLLCIWMAFIPTLMVSLNWLCERPWLAAVLGFVMVPFSYLGGAHLSGSAMALSLPWVFLITGGVWAVLLPLLSGLVAKQGMVLDNCFASESRSLVNRMRERVQC